MRVYLTVIVIFLTITIPACTHNKNKLVECCIKCTSPDEAMSSCSALIQMGIFHGKELALLLKFRGNAHLRKDEYDLAILDYDQSIQLNPNVESTLLNRGAAYAKKDEYDKAIQDLDKAIKLDPNDANAFSNRGLAYRNKGEYEKAIQDFDQAIKLDPKDIDILVRRGFAYQLKGDFDRAIHDYNQVIKMNPSDGEAFNARGTIYSSKGEYNLAFQDFDQAIRLNPSEVAPFGNRGMTYFFLGQFSNAQKDLSKALELDPGYAYSMIWVYLVKTRLNQDALGELSKNASRVDLKKWPGQVISLYLGDLTSEAFLSLVKDLNKNRDKQQMHCEAYFYLGEKALIQGDQDKALFLFKKSIQTQAIGFVEYYEAQAELKRLLHE